MPRFWNKLTARLTTLLAVAVALASPAMARAFTIVPECARQTQQPGEPPPAVPSLNCLLQTFTNIAQLILGVTGSFALLMFVYGGFRMVLARGNSSEVEKAKTILKNALIGIFIILTASMFIQYGLQQLIGVNTEDTEVKIPGTQCESDQPNPNKPGENYTGIYVQMPNSSEVRCIALCSELSVAGYECTDETAGKNCLVGLCKGEPVNVLCCREEQP